MSEADASALSRAEAFARIRLLRSPNIGPVSYRQLMLRFGDATRALEALPDLASRGGSAYRPAPSARIEDEVAAVRQAGARYLFHDATDYPALLGEMRFVPVLAVIAALVLWQHRANISRLARGEEPRIGASK